MQNKIAPKQRDKFKDHYHELAYAIYYCHHGWDQRGPGSKKQIWRLFDQAIGMGSKRTIDDWSGLRSKCRCPYHRWDELTVKIKQGVFPAPDLREVRMRLLQQRVPFSAPIPLPKTENDGEVGIEGFNQNLDAGFYAMINAAKKFFEGDKKSVFTETHHALACLKLGAEYAFKRDGLFQRVESLPAIAASKAMSDNVSNGENTTLLKATTKIAEPPKVEVNNPYEQEDEDDF